MIMKKIFSIVAAALFLSMNANAISVTNYKNLYAEITAVPSSAGEVYLETVNDEDNSYVLDISEDYGPTAFIMATLAHNGQESEDNSINSSQDVYFVKAYAECPDSYELVCYSNKINENGVYGPNDCYAVFNHVDGDDSRATSWEVTGLGDLININKASHEADGSSADDTPSRDEAFSSGSWSETPDAPIYAIFRKKGEATPYFDETLVPEKPEPDNSTDVSSMTNAIYIEKTLSTPGSEINLAVKMKSASPITAVEFTVELADSVATLGTPVLSTQRTSESRTDYFGYKQNSGNVKVVAFSHNNYEFSGNDGVIVTIPIQVGNNVALKDRYEVKVTNVVVATADGTSISCGNVMAYFVVTDTEGINEVSTGKDDNKIYRIDGVQVKNANQPGLYIQNGKTILVK